MTGISRFLRVANNVVGHVVLVWSVEHMLSAMSLLTTFVVVKVNIK
jgi:hypothetical protein